MGEKPYNKQRDIIAGLQIFAANGGKFCGAEHDVFFAQQGQGKKLSADDVKALMEHGWFIQSELCNGCAEDGEESFADEDGDRHGYACSSWAVFV